MIVVTRLRHPVRHGKTILVGGRQR
jgi:hypothetical protein